MSEPNQLELELIDPPQLGSDSIELLLEMLAHHQKLHAECEPHQLGYKVRMELDNVYKCILLLNYKVGEVNKLISRRYELEQLLEKQNG